MSPKDIKVGCTYVNRGKGRTIRTVKAIGSAHVPGAWFSEKRRPDEPGVLFVDSNGKEQRLYISSFAKWAGREVE